jgi:hypothetical protein
MVGIWKFKKYNITYISIKGDNIILKSKYYTQKKIINPERNYGTKHVIGEEQSTLSRC